MSFLPCALQFLIQERTKSLQFELKCCAVRKIEIALKFQTGVNYFKDWQSFFRWIDNFVGRIAYVDQKHRVLAMEAIPYSKGTIVTG